MFWNLNKTVAFSFAIYRISNIFFSTSILHTEWKSLFVYNTALNNTEVNATWHITAVVEHYYYITTEVHQISFRLCKRLLVEVLMDLKAFFSCGV